MNDRVKGGILGSLRNRIVHEIQKHRESNAVILQLRLPLATRALHQFFAEYSIRRYILVYTAIIISYVVIEIGITLAYPAALRPGADDPNIGTFLKELTSFFLGAQVVMVGLLFPIAVGLITLIVQREGASSTIADVQVYYAESLAYGIGASGIALSIVLATQLVWPVHLIINLFGFQGPSDFSKILLTALHLLWLIINFTGLWYFLTISLSFVRPTVRARLRRRYAANVSIPEDLFGRLFQKFYFDAEASMLPEDRDTKVRETRPIQFGSSGGWGDVEIADPKLSGKFVHDVWMKPLCLAARRWLKRCDEQSSSSHQGASCPALLFVFAGDLRHPLPEGGVLCRRDNGVPLSKLERLVIRQCFRLKKGNQESKVMKDRSGPSEMLEELADKVIGHIDRLAVISFKNALDEMVDFHRFLIDAYATTSEAGKVASFAQTGSWIAPQPHEEWIRQYRRIFERAVGCIGRENAFVQMLAGVPRRLFPADGRNASPEVTAGLLDLGNIFVNRLEAWLTAHRVYVPDQAEGQPLLPRLAGSDKQAYEEIIRNFIGAWETTRPVVVSIYRWRKAEIEPDEQWRRYCESWPLLQRHLWNTTYMLAVAVWNEDEIGADHYSDMLLRWFDGFRHQLKQDHHVFKALLAPDLLDKEWQDAQGIVPHPEWCRPIPAGVFSAILQDLLDDVIFTVSGIMLGWFVDGRQNSDIAPRTVYRLLTDSVQDDGTHRVKRKAGLQALMTSFLRMYAFPTGRYGGWLDGFFDFLNRMSETPKVPNRFYGSFTPDRCEALLIPWLSCLLAFMPPEGDAGAVRALARLTGRGDAFPEGDVSLRGVLDGLGRAKEASTTENRINLEKGTLALQRHAQVEERITRLVSIFDQVVDAIEGQRRERLKSCPVDQAKLEAIRQQFEQAITTGNGGIEVFQGFFIDRDVTALREHEARLSPMEKGWFTEPPMAQEPVNLWEVVVGDVQRFAASLVWRDFLARPRRVIDTQDEASFLTALRDEAKKITKAGRQAILLVRDWYDPGWIDDWFSWDDRRPPGVDISKKNNVRANHYIGTIDEVDVYNGYALPQEGQSFLFPADIFKIVKYGTDPQRRVVDLKFSEGEEGHSGFLTIHFSQETKWKNDEVVVLQYPANNPEDHK